ncbi:heparinase II/III family protein [Candidatus Woesearchaeota archaeon]|nr:heparinase II/III family protein [Candidatus Woesearchaeota archaeon]
MEIKQIIQRIKKNPETIPQKSIRFLKRSIIEKIRPEEKISKEKVAELKARLNTKSVLKRIKTKDETLEIEAKKILNKEFEILGKEYKLEKIEWNKDFHSGKIWENKHFTEMQYDISNENADKKIPWELSKFQHLITLVQWYINTGDKIAITECEMQIKDWVEHNPFQQGINWVTPMECAIRAINWIQLYSLLEQDFSEECKEILIEQLYLHGKFIRRNLEWSPAKENHYLSDVTGLYFLGTFFNNNWKSFAKKELEKEMQRQVSEDGVDYEASLNYHRLVTELLLINHILAENNQDSFSEEYKKRLEKMCEFIMYYTSHTGKAPSIGDTDNGRVLNIWDKDVNDHRDILTIGSALFKREDFKARGNFHQKLLPLLDKEAYDAIKEENKELQSKAFTDYYIMRDKDIFLLTHCGGIGRKGYGGHGHNDQLSFVFGTKKRDYVIDAGTYCYTSDKKQRQLFRSTKAHNSLVLNNQEQNEIEEETPFSMEHKTKSICFQWQTDKLQDIFIGKHFGYNPNIITREIHYEQLKKEITITERTKEDALMELNFTFEPSIEIKQEGEKIILNNEIEIDCEEIPSIEITPYSQEYGQLSETKKITIKKQGNNLITKIKLHTEPIKILQKTKKERSPSKEEEYY